MNQASTNLQHDAYCYQAFCLVKGQSTERDKINMVDYTQLDIKLKTAVIGMRQILLNNDVFTINDSNISRFYYDKHLGFIVFEYFFDDKVQVIRVFNVPSQLTN